MVLWPGIQPLKPFLSERWWFLLCGPSCDLQLPKCIFWRTLNTLLMRILASRILCCGCNRQIHTDYRNPVEKKGRYGLSLRQREGPETSTWTGFYCFSRHITSRMALIYYAQVQFTLGGYLLQKTKERMLTNTSKKDICKCKGKSGQTHYSPYLCGLAQTLGS